VTVSAGASFAPGASIGTLTINNNLTLAAGSTTVMEVNATALTSDLANVTGNVSLGGTLVLKNLSGTLKFGDMFTLFAAGTRSGAFSSVVSQTPNQTVTWDTSNLVANGTVSVANAAPAPVALSSAVTGGMLNFTWPANQIGWQLQHQVNPLTIGLYTNWVPVAGSTATNAVSVPVDSNEATEFYRLVFPAQ
jgi:outer membrane autotransporter protein